MRRARGIASSPTRSSSGRSPCSSSSSRSSSPTTRTRACRSCRRRSCKFQVANGANLLPGNEVREGGCRIGVVDDMKPRPAARRHGRRRGDAEARQGRRRDPASTRRSNLRPRSVLGLKYVELTRGRVEARRSRTATRCPPTRSRYPGRARRLLPDLRRADARGGARRTSQGFGNALAGRGASLNATIADAAALPRAPRAGRRARWPTRDTQLGALLRASSATPRAIVAPVADRYAHSFERRRRHVRGVVARPRRAAARRSAAARRRCAPASARSASSARSSPTLPRLLARAAQRRRTSCRARCRAITAALRTGIPVLRAHAGDQRRAARRRSARCAS